MSLLKEVCRRVEARMHGGSWQDFPAAEGEQRMLLLEKCRMLLEKQDFTRADFEAYSDAMLALLGGRRHSGKYGTTLEAELLLEEREQPSSTVYSFIKIKAEGNVASRHIEYHVATTSLSHPLPDQAYLAGQNESLHIYRERPNPYGNENGEFFIADSYQGPLFRSASAPHYITGKVERPNMARIVFPEELQQFGKQFLNLYKQLSS